MANLDYAGLYEQIREFERLQVVRDEVTWIDRYTPPAHPAETVLYLSCNILRTTHLALELVGVFKALGLDFVAVGGPQFCCGILHHRNGDLEAGARLSQASAAKFASYQPRQVVTWCPSCHHHYQDVVYKEAPAPFPIIHTTEFLAGRAASIAWRREVRARVAVHVHLGPPQQEREAAAALRLLAAVPGVEVVGTIQEPALGYHCAGADIVRLGPDGLAAVQSRLAQQARQMGADTLVTLYHSCHREWFRVAGEGLAVRSYISLVAEGLDCGQTDWFQTFKRLGDPDAIVALSRRAWESHGLTREQAWDFAARHFT